MNEIVKTEIKGRMIIRDLETNEIVRDHTNAIHPQNMALLIARALSRDSNGYIYSLSFGNGGTFYNSSQQIVYRPPITIGSSANLYNQTYSVQVDDQSTGTPITNSVLSASSLSPAISSTITVTAQLNANEPLLQAAADNLPLNATTQMFMFDELGLKSSDGMLLSHLIFSPFEKTSNRAFLITYTLTVLVS